MQRKHFINNVVHTCPTLYGHFKTLSLTIQAQKQDCVTTTVAIDTAPKFGPPITDGYNGAIASETFTACQGLITHGPVTRTGSELHPSDDHDLIQDTAPIVREMTQQPPAPKLGQLSPCRLHIKFIQTVATMATDYQVPWLHQSRHGHLGVICILVCCSTPITLALFPGQATCIASRPPDY